ncbi:MAG: DUF58 domain-containing protein [Flavobacteriales bacterium]|nr:DUF58 domain-containing protein [Flavobacteriales bacterium]
MTTFFKQLYLRNRFFLYWVAVVMLFCIGFGVPFFYLIAKVAFIALMAITMLDLFMLFLNKSKVGATRVVNTQLSLGDKNTVRIKVISTFNMPVSLRIIDELPYQLQVRDFEEWVFLNPRESKEFIYLIQPNQRGVYAFHDINIYVSTILRVVERRVKINSKQEVAVYPSILQMKKYELQVFSKTAIFQGIKKIRRIGNNNEFEQIKTYVQGDDIRSVNWKATSRKGELMVNQYQDERSQQVYCVIDKSRSMRMPFNSLTLLDHSINCALSLSNIILKKNDKVGVVTFSDKLGSRLPAENSSTQLRRIMDVLYRQKTHFMESNYERLYFGLRNTIKGRSMVLLFTNFESMYALKRNLALLRKINQQHLLVVVFFENSKLKKAAKMESNHVKDIYVKTLAGKFALEKELIAFELRKYGIQSILTKPENLSVDTINKYLEIKSRGML